MSSAAIADPVEVGVLPLWEDTAAPVVSRVAERPPQARPKRDGSDHGSAAADAAVTLAHVVSEAWGALEAGFVADCLLCGGRVHPRWSAGAGVVGGRCDDCGTEIQ